MTKNRIGRRQLAIRSRRNGIRPVVEAMETRALLANFLVTTTSDTPVSPSPEVPAPLTLRQAITAANANPGPDTISFDLPAQILPSATDPSVVDFDRKFQTWRIHVDTPLPAITDPVSIDGYTQNVLNGGSTVNEQQSVTLEGPPTGGSFTLSFEGQTTASIPFNASVAANVFQIQAALENLSNVGAGNVFVSFGNVAQPGLYKVTFIGSLSGINVDPLTANASGLTPATTISVATDVDGSATITSDANKLTIGTNAAVRVILDGSVNGTQANFAGLTLTSDHNRIRGLSIDGFATGIAIQGPDAVGNLIQGNYLGRYLLYLNPNLLSVTSTVGGIGNGVGIVVASPNNNSVGGVSPETHNAIAGNVSQGVILAPGAEGNQVVGNLIGVLEESLTFYYQVGNGAAGVVVQSSSNAIGGAVTGATNVISANGTYGIHIVGPAATRNRVEANYIGTDINGTFVFGQGNPGNGQLSTGNLRDGIFIDNAPDNQIGIPGGTVGVKNPAGNVISGNFGAGVRIAGAAAKRNVIQGNVIGTDLGGASALPNFQEGIILETASNSVGGAVQGAGNLISGNRTGVLVRGIGATGNLIAGNFIGTDGKGAYDLGNAHEGVRIENASRNTVGGLDAASQNVISGNDIGVSLVGATATANLVAGNFIGTDATGARSLGNSAEGVRIDGAPANSIGGGTTSARNLISANQSGVTIAGSNGNLIQGNFIGTDVTGLLPLGNEFDGVFVTRSASRNSIGGATPSQGNSIAFNLRDGVRIETAGSVDNGILSNSIFSNGFGIDLVAPGDPPSGVTPNSPGSPHNGPNQLQNHPALTLASSNISTSTSIQGTLNSIPNTTFTVQFFSNLAADPSGYGQGQTLLGVANVTTDSSGNASFYVTFSTALPAGRFITATATDPSNNTSEFSNSVVVRNLPGSLQFNLSNYVVSESSGIATITVTRENGSSGSVSVAYATSDATPGAGGEYVPTSGTLDFGDGEISKTFTITILNNDTYAPDQGVLLTLSNPTGGASLGSPNPAILTIRNDDTPTQSTFQFTMGSYDAASGQTSVTITVTRAGGADGPATVDYATSNGTAVAGVDYTAVSGTLVFQGQQTTRSFVVPILDTASVVGDKTIGLTLSDPTGGAGLGSPSTAVLTIRDTVGPTVTSVNFLKNRRGGIVALVGAFSEALDSATATDLVNYGYSVRTAGRDHKFGTADDLLIPFLAAIYNADSRTVTLPLRRGIHPPTPFRFTINQSTNVSGVGVSDTGGNLLDGANDGSPGSPFVVVLSGRTGPYPSSPSTSRHVRRPLHPRAHFARALSSPKVTHAHRHA